jgi:dTDP-4-amino-4,6-dideoxygalactose transaminase
MLSGSALRLPVEQPGTRHVYHIYAVLTEQRRELMDSLHSSGVQTGIHYPFPVHLLPAYSDLGYKAGDFPVSERIATQEVSLPMFPELSDSQIKGVVEALTKFEVTGDLKQFTATT